MIALCMLAAAVAGGVVIGINLSSETSAASESVARIEATHPVAMLEGLTARPWPSTYPASKFAAGMTAVAGVAAPVAASALDREWPSAYPREKVWVDAHTPPASAAPLKGHLQGPPKMDQGDRKGTA